MAQKQHHLTFDIDLLHPVGGQSKIYLQIFRWLLGTGRFIVVFVEIIVIGAFISRFKLDSDLVNLQDQIKEQVPYIQSLKKDESLIRQTQFQISSIKQIKANNPDWSKLITKLASLTPLNTRLSNINLDSTQNASKTLISIAGEASSNIELAAFLKAIQDQTTFQDAQLTNISYDKRSVIFTITATIKP